MGGTHERSEKSRRENGRKRRRKVMKELRTAEKVEKEGRNRERKEIGWMAGWRERMKETREGGRVREESDEGKI